MQIRPKQYTSTKRCRNFHQYRTNSLPSGNNTTPASASYIVNLVINGTSTVVHVASDADAQALINALRAAKLSAGS